MRRCTGLSNGTLSGYANSCRERRTEQDGQTDRQTDSGMSRQEGRQAGRLAGRQECQLDLAYYMPTLWWRLYVRVCVCAYLCVCAASQKLIRQSEIEYCSCKMVKCFFAQQQVLIVPLLSLPLSISLSIISSCRGRVIFVLSALFFGHAFLVFRNYASFI